ncbi:putative protein phosphatase 2C 27 [Platanthera guangdongensis]|uniref:protein-serine/threonine phosphatase n=1 Tax=Platanthera guangdongensis TaxID=2320717 RepID=A0ABR2M3Q9_9ASPA
MLKDRHDGLAEGLDSPWQMEQLKDGKPPRHLSIIRHCASTAKLVDSSEQDSDLGIPSLSTSLDDQSGFFPIFRSGSCSEIRPKLYMEDEHICINDIVDHLGTDADLPAPSAFNVVFDGHSGTDAAASARKNLLKFITEDQYFPTFVEKAMRSAFVMADHAFADSRYLDCSSGTTVLDALIFGSSQYLPVESSSTV